MTVETGADRANVEPRARGVALRVRRRRARSRRGTRSTPCCSCGDEPPTPRRGSNPPAGIETGTSASPRRILSRRSARADAFRKNGETDEADPISPAATAFCSARLGGRTAAPRGRVLVACGDGVDRCVGPVAAARLIARMRAGSNPDASRAPAPVTKDEVRRRLAEVSARHPEAMPSRGRQASVQLPLARFEEPKGRDRSRRGSSRIMVASMLVDHRARVRARI